jgi:hypothetical protein
MRSNGTGTGCTPGTHHECLGVDKVGTRRGHAQDRGAPSIVLTMEIELFLPGGIIVRSDHVIPLGEISDGRESCAFQLPVPPGPFIQKVMLSAF